MQVKMGVNVKIEIEDPKTGEWIDITAAFREVERNKVTTTKQATKTGEWVN
jgi:hypothetical protein